MNITSTAYNTYRFFKMDREEAKKLLDKPSQRVTLGEHEFLTRSQALDAIGKTVEMPPRGLRLIQTATAPQSPEQRKKDQVELEGSNRKPEFAVGGLLLAAGVMGLLDKSAPAFFGVTGLGLGITVLGLSALARHRDIDKAQSAIGPDDYTMVENRVEEHVLPGESGKDYDVLRLEGPSAHYYRVYADKEDSGKLDFEEIGRGHFRFLTRSGWVPPIVDLNGAVEI